jgi:hypothetical protein
MVLEEAKRVGGIITDADEETLKQAQKLHRKATMGGWVRRLIGFLSGIDRSLADLNSLRYSAVLLGWSYVGVQEIAIDQVVGSEGFCDEFDRGFYPRPGHDELRWLEIAIGYLSGSRMPVIEIVQVDSMYYAQTGQYQLSVARAQGKKMITAYVTSWDVQGKVYALI